MSQSPAFPMLTLSALTLIAVFACTEPESEAPPPVSAEHEAMAIAIAAVPSAFTVVSDQGPTLELEHRDESGAARLSIEATGEMPGAINLVAEAESMQDWFEQQPQGQFYGNLELGTPYGPAFTARGSYLTESGAVEELRVFALHPGANRMLRLTYSYPPGTGKVRLQQLAEVLGEIEALQPASGADS